VKVRTTVSNLRREVLQFSALLEKLNQNVQKLEKRVKDGESLKRKHETTLQTSGEVVEKLKIELKELEKHKKDMIEKSQKSRHDISTPSFYSFVVVQYDCKFP
jgi:DNA repair ATPase RecN